MEVSRAIINYDFGNMWEEMIWPVLIHLPDGNKIYRKKLRIISGAMFKIGTFRN
jgi:hypothetical protein